MIGALFAFLIGFALGAVVVGVWSWDCLKRSVDRVDQVRAEAAEVAYRAAMTCEAHGQPHFCELFGCQSLDAIGDRIAQGIPWPEVIE